MLPAVSVTEIELTPVGKLVRLSGLVTDFAVGNVNVCICGTASVLPFEEAELNRVLQI